MKKVYLVLLVVTFGGFISSCGSFGSGVEPGKAHLVASQKLDIKTGWGFQSAVPLDGGECVVSGVSSADSAVLFLYDDSLHPVWTKKLYADLAAKGRASLGGVQNMFGSSFGKTDGDWPELQFLYRAGSSIILPINSTKDNLTHGHAAVLDATSGDVLRDVPIMDMNWDDFGPGHDGSSTTDYKEAKSGMGFQPRFSPDSSRVLFYKYHLTATGADFTAKIFDRALNSSSPAEWRVTFDSLKDRVDGAAVDNDGSIYVFTRNADDDDSLAACVTRRTLDGSLAQLRFHPTLGEDSNIRIYRVCVSSHGPAYYACGIDRGGKLTAGAVAVFDFTNKRAALHRLELPKQLIDSLTNSSSFDDVELTDLYISDAEKRIVLTFEQNDESTEFYDPYDGGTINTSRPISDITITGHKSKNILVTAFDLDGTPQWVNGFSKDQSEDQNFLTNISHTFTISPDHSVAYWYRDDRYIRRIRYDLATGKQVSGEDELNIVRLGLSNNNLPKFSKLLSDGSYLMFSDLGAMAMFHDSWVFKLAE
ncbi:MAG: hypothetical protein ACHQNE_08355 [Candidatus Kapaibacterium sp.]